MCACHSIDLVQTVARVCRSFIGILFLFEGITEASVVMVTLFP